MKIKVLLLGLGGIACLAHAQSVAPGKYDGSMLDHNNRPIGLTLVIDSVEGGAVKGKLTRSSRQCFGDYEMAGKLEGNALTMKTVGKGGNTGDCTLTLKMTVDGGKMQGVTGNGRQVQFSK